MTITTRQKGIGRGSTLLESDGSVPVTASFVPFETTVADETDVPATVPLNLARLSHVAAVAAALTSSPRLAARMTDR
jgi:hypothetical protein